MRSRGYAMEEIAFDEIVKDNKNSEMREYNLGIIDLGTNSARLMIVNIKENGSATILKQVKYMVRLGENSFEKRQLQEEAMLRGISVLQAFSDTCKTYNVAKMEAVATAAVRRAGNGREFVRRVAEKTGIELDIISGAEEARLIYLGVSSGLSHTFGQRVFIDIGGGSTEVIVGNSVEYQFLDSLTFGCVMLTNRFVPHKDKVKSEEFEAIKDYVRQSSAHAFQSLKNYSFVDVVASSGTAIALYELSQKLDLKIKTPLEHNILSLEALQAVSKYICDLTAEERKNLPGISMKRSEVLPAGAAILLTLLEELKMTKISISHLNLQNGALVDHLNTVHTKHSPHFSQNGTQGSLNKDVIRKKSVEALAKAFHYEEKHSEHVKNLALMLHDSAVDCELIEHNRLWREYLSFAATLHDIGISIAYSRHFSHSYYIITHSELIGFTEEEKEYIAQLAYFQRSRPSSKHAKYTALPEKIQEKILKYSSFLSLAENMERLHRQHIYEAAFVIEEDEIVLYAQQFAPSLVEEFAVRSMQKSLEKIFHKNVTIHFST